MFFFKEVSQVIDARNLYLALYDESSKSVSYPYEKDERCGKLSGRRLAVKKYDPLIRTVVSARKAISLSGKELRSQLSAPNLPQEQIPKSWMGVPLRSDVQVFGVLAVHSYLNDDAYGTHEREFFKFVARQVGGMVERIRTHESLMDNQKKLSAVNKELELFIYKSSHDLKGPISSAQGLVNLAKGETDVESAAKYMSMIGVTMEKAQRILDDLTSITVIRQGALESRPISLTCFTEPTNIHPAVDWVCTLSGTLWRNCRVQFH